MAAGGSREPTPGAEPLRWAREVRSALDRIPAPQRRLLVLLYDQRLSYRLAAAELGVSDCSIGERHRAALRALNSALGLERRPAQPS